MRTCPSCGAVAPLTAAWCGQCYATLDGGTAAGQPALAGIPDDSPIAVTPPPLRAALLTIVAITVGAAAMATSTWLANDTSIEPATYIRYAIVLTLAVYAVVGVLLVTQLTTTVRLRWTDGSPALGVGIGVGIGAALGAVVLALASAVAGHLDPDPRVVLEMSEGTATQITATLLLTCLAAPLVEEVLFRGLLLASLRRYGAAVAIWVSALAFAAWHLMPAVIPVVYYTLLGALLGWLYLRRGLVASMAAHLGFNAVLTLAALSVVLTPGPTVHVADMSLRLASGWKTAPAQALPSWLSSSGNVIAVEGPSGAGLVVAAFATPVAPSTDSVVEQLSGGSLAGAQAVDRSSLREVKLPAGVAVEVDEMIGHHRGRVIFLPLAGHSYEFVVQTSGSVKAAADVHRMLQTMVVGRG